MNESDKMVEKFTTAPGGSRYRELFGLLAEHGLTALGKSNTETLLFQRRIPGGGAEDILAFRLTPQPVISFPRSYWLPQARRLSEIMEPFSWSEKPAVEGKVSDSQYSSGQIIMTRAKHERVMQICRDVCESLGG